MSNKQYLGDSVYVDFDGYNLVLTTENGMGPSNTIIIEPPVYYALVRYAESLREKAQELQRVPIEEAPCPDQ